MEIILIILVIGLISFAAFSHQHKPPKNESFRSEERLYKVNTKFISPAERSFFGVLTKAISNKGMVFTKIRVADIITPENTANRSQWQTSFNKISAKHFDFVVCNPSTLIPILAIELDDSSHQNSNKKDSDSTKDYACKSANFPLIRFNVKRAYSIQDVRSALSDYLPDINLSSENSASSCGAATAISSSELPLCPVCNSDMVLRTGKKGNHAGKQFWGCSRYPSCRGLIPANT